MWELFTDAATGVKKQTHPIRNGAELQRHVEKLIQRGEGTAYLCPPGEADRLVIGVEGDVGLAFLSTEEDESIIAVAPDAQEDLERGRHLPFNFGGTATEISLRYCLPLDLLRSIVEAFYQTEALMLGVTWEAPREDTFIAGLCERHGCELQDDVVPVLPERPSVPDDYESDSLRYFPNANPFVCWGKGGSTSETEAVRYCPECRKARQAWELGRQAP